ncbi:SDR family oxidoreductase [Streptomyces abikoensis]|uniref:SDR family oxidoreductase n=1 Tax=Streptomyces abikoensis TaxID=97398 RepID=UPI0033F61927
MLLTGATGFLGAFLLRELLDRTGVTVWCVVSGAWCGPPRQSRPTSAYAGRSPPIGCGARPSPARSRRPRRPGPAPEPRLGPSPETYDTPARTVEIVYHDGARVNHPEVGR